jgi:catechol 2,3-dioxygenase-like lactoylglutathione lyase family enzyme
MQGFKDFRHVAIGVSDGDRSLAFYRDLLGFPLAGRLRYQNQVGLVIDVLDVGHNAVLELFSFSVPTKPSVWQANDLQLGLRHVGFKVRDVDTEVARLKAVGVEFTMEPTDAVGGVRIAFFKDPDGTLLEVVQGELQYHKTGTAGPVVAVPPSDDRPLIFDHVAITVADLDQTLRFYRDVLGFPVLGQFFFNDERGFTITYVQAGTSVLEFFSFSSPTIPSHGDGDETMLGLQRIGFEVDNVDAAADYLNAADVVCIEQPNDAPGNIRTALVAGPDGNTLELIEGTRHDGAEGKVYRPMRMPLQE